jgi:hypothetical protein
MPTPLSFRKLCAKSELSGVVDILRRAQTRWVAQVKDYRDCFIHYTPVNNESFISCVRYTDGWEVRCSLPVNPNIREALGFRFSRRRELLRYAILVYRQLKALDRVVGKEITKAWRAGMFPARTQNLFFVGARSTPPPSNALNPPVRPVTGLAKYARPAPARPAG